jgi:hypothetical protein
MVTAAMQRTRTSYPHLGSGGFQHDHSARFGRKRPDMVGPQLWEVSMARRRLLITAVTSVSSLALALAGAGLAGPAWAAAGKSAAGQGGACSAGAHTLSA